MSPRLLTVGARLGFGLLLGGLVAFQWLFVREAGEAAAALEAGQRLKQARAELALDEALRGALEVGLTRLEVVETLPLADEDGLLWVRGGVQRIPRLVGAGRRGEGPLRAGHAAAVLESALGQPPAPALTREVEAALARGARPPDVPGLRWSQALAAQLRAERWEVATTDAAPRLALWLWVLEQAAEVPDDVRVRVAPELVLRAWPWLDREGASSACQRAQRLAASRGGDTERLGAACRRGLDAVAVPTRPGAQPHLVGEWLMVERLAGLQGVRVSVAEHLAGVEAAMRKSGALGDDEHLAVDERAHADETARDPLAGGAVDAGATARTGQPPAAGETAGALDARRASNADAQGEGGGAPAPDEVELGPPPTAATGPLVRLRVDSPSHAAAVASVRSALLLKSGLLAVTALLGLGVVLLARLAARRREETLAVQREFIATVSHELRTPLAGIRLLAETLERKLGQEPAARDYPRRLVQAADALGFLVENILSFNRLEAGRWEPRRAPFDLATLEPLLRDDAALAVDVEVQVRCEGLASLPPASLDPELFRVLVLNLLRNAWKYGQRRPVTFEVRGAVEGPWLVLHFTDNGPGLPREAWETVFEAFHRLPRAEGRAVGGSGLGLALARRIATLHGGTLRVADSSGAGTRFELRLPRSGQPSLGW